MAAAFNLTAQLNLVGPTNVKKIAGDIRREIGTVTGEVKFKIDQAAIVNAGKLNTQLRKLNDTLAQTRVLAGESAGSISQLGSALGNVKLSKVSSESAKASKGIQDVGETSKKAAKDVGVMSNELAEFGRQSGLAIRRFAAFSIVSSVIYKLNSALSSAIGNFIDFDKELVRVAQVTGKDTSQLEGLVAEITKLSTGLGVTSDDLIKVSSTLAQAGLSAQDTEQALKALALSANAPSFDSLNDTVEGSIALMRQFGIKAKDLEQALGAVNAVSAQFAVEASDIITAIQRTGGVFATASRGVSSGTEALNEFIAVFTSVRATTRESAETIATGLRTIFARIQRKDTIEALKQYGVLLTDLEGKFVGPFEAVKRLSEGLSKLDPRDLKFSQIVEELGGFRQIGKVIPLIQQFATAEDALRVAQQGAGSLAADNAKAQLALANKLTKVREEFVALVREFGKNTVLQSFIGLTLSLTTSLLKLVRAGKGLFPILTLIGGMKAVSGITQFAGGFAEGVRPKTKGGSVSKSIGTNIGEILTGSKADKESQNFDKAASSIDKAVSDLAGEISTAVPAITQLASSVQQHMVELSANTAALTANTTSIDALTQVISSLNLGGGGPTLNSGGIVRKFASGGFVPGSGNSDTVPAMLTPGEFVMRKSAVKSIGSDNLHKMNKYDLGGRVEEKGSTLINLYSSLKDIINPKETYAATVDAVSIDAKDSGNDRLIANMIKNKRKQKSLLMWKNFETSLSQTYGLSKAGKSNSYLDFPPDVAEAKFLKADAGYGEDPEDGPIKGNNNQTMLAKLIGQGLYKKRGSNKITDYYPNNPNQIRGIVNNYSVGDAISKNRYGEARLSGGGYVQKFMAGGVAEQTQAMTMEDAAKKSRKEILDVLKERRGGLQATAKAVGVDAFDIFKILGSTKTDEKTKILQEAIRKEYVKTYNRQAGAAKGLETRLQNRGLEFAAAGMFNKSEQLGSVTKVIESEKLSSSPTVKIIRGVLNKKLAENLETMFMEGARPIAAKASEMMMINDILEKVGLGRQLNLDFDRTLADGADEILSDPSTPKFAEFGDRNKVAAALKTAKLTSLGSELASLVEKRPDLISLMKVITARPQSTLDLVQEWLSSKGLPIPLSQFTGLGGPSVSAGQIADLKASLLEPGSLFADDDPRNIQAALKRKAEGIETYQYGANLITPNANTEGSIQGGLLEWVVQNLGGPGAVKGFGFDFPQGLGSAAKYFNIPDDVPTDLKRTISGASTIKDNIVTYLKNVMGYAKGGVVPGTGDGDTVPAMLNVGSSPLIPTDITTFVSGGKVLPPPPPAPKKPIGTATKRPALPTPPVRTDSKAKSLQEKTIPKDMEEIYKKWPTGYKIAGGYWIPQGHRSIGVGQFAGEHKPSTDFGGSGWKMRLDPLQDMDNIIIADWFLKNKKLLSTYKIAVNTDKPIWTAYTEKGSLTEIQTAAKKAQSDLAKYIKLNTVYDDPDTIIPGTQISGRFEIRGDERSGTPRAKDIVKTINERRKSISKYKNFYALFKNSPLFDDGFPSATSGSEGVPGTNYYQWLLAQKKLAQQSKDEQKIKEYEDAQKEEIEIIKAVLKEKTPEYSGSAPKKFAAGGFVPGVGNRDTVPAMLDTGDFVIRKSSVKKLGFASGGQVPALLTPGEYVIPKAQAQKIGYGTLNRMNKFGKYNAGGTVGFIQNFADGTGTGGAKPVEIEISPEAEKEIKKLREEMANLWMMAGRKMGYSEAGQGTREVQGMQLTVGARRAMYAVNPAKSGEELAQRIETESGQKLRPKTSEFFRALSPQLAKNAELYEQGGFGAKYSQGGGVVNAFETGRYGANDPKTQQRMQEEVGKKLENAKTELSKIATLEEKIANIRKGGAKAVTENPKPAATPVPPETPKPIVQTPKPPQPPKPPFKFNMPPPPSDMGGGGKGPPFKFNMPPPPGGKPPGPPKFFMPPPPSQLVPMLKRQQAEAIGAKKAALATGGVTQGQEYEDLKFKYTKQAGRAMGLSRTVVERKNLKANQQTQEEEKKQKEKETKARDTKIQQLSEKTKINAEMLLIKAILDNTKTIRACYCKDVRGDTGAENTEELINSVNDLKQNVVTLDDTVKEKNKAEATAAAQEAGTTEGKNPFEDDKITVPFVDMLDSLANKAESAGNKLNANFSDAAGNVTKFGLATKQIADSVSQAASRTANGLASLNEQFVNTKIGSVFQGLTSLKGLISGTAVTGGLSMAAEAAGGYETTAGTALNIGSSIAEFATSIGTATSALGPFGTAIGSVIGVAVGLAKGLADAANAAEEERMKMLQLAKDDSAEKAAADFGVFFSSLEPDIKDFNSGIKNLSDTIVAENEIIKSSSISLTKRDYLGFGREKTLEGSKLTEASRELAASRSATGGIAKNIISQTMRAGDTNLAGAEKMLGPAFGGLSQAIANADANYVEAVQKSINDYKSGKITKDDLIKAERTERDAVMKRTFAEQQLAAEHEEFRKTVTEARKRLESQGVGTLENIIGSTPEQNRDMAKNMQAAEALFAGDATAMQREAQKAYEEAYAKSGGTELEKQQAGEQAAAKKRSDITQASNLALELSGLNPESQEYRNAKAMALETQLKAQGVDTTSGLAGKVLESLKKPAPEIEAQNKLKEATLDATKELAKNTAAIEDVPSQLKDALTGSKDFSAEAAGVKEQVGTMLYNNAGVAGSLVGNAVGLGLAYRAGGRGKVPSSEVEGGPSGKAKPVSMEQKMLEAERKAPAKKKSSWWSFGGGDAGGKQSKTKPVPEVELGASGGGKSALKKLAITGGALLASTGAGYLMSGGGEDTTAEVGGETEIPPSSEIVGLLAKIEENTRACCMGAEGIAASDKATEYTTAMLDSQKSLKENTAALSQADTGFDPKKGFTRVDKSLAYEFGTGGGLADSIPSIAADVIGVKSAIGDIGTGPVPAGTRVGAMGYANAGMQTFGAAMSGAAAFNEYSKGNYVNAGIETLRSGAGTLNTIGSLTNNRTVGAAGDALSLFGNLGNIATGRSMARGTLGQDIISSGSDATQVLAQLPAQAQGEIIKRVAPKAVSQSLSGFGTALGFGQSVNLGKLGTVGTKSAGGLALGTVLSGGFNAYEAISDPSKYHQKMMKASSTGEEGRASYRMASNINDIFGTKFETATGAAGTAMDMLVGAMEGFVDPVGTIVQGLYTATGSAQDFGGALYNLANEGSIIKGAGKLTKQEEESRTSRYTMDESGNVTKEQKNKQDYDYGLSTEESAAVRSYASSQKQLEQVQSLAKNGGDLSGFAQQFGLEPGATNEQVVAQAQRAFENSGESLKQVATRKAGEKTWFGADKGMIDKQLAGYRGSAAQYLETQSEMPREILQTDKTNIVPTVFGANVLDQAKAEYDQIEAEKARQAAAAEQAAQQTMSYDSMVQQTKGNLFGELPGGQLQAAPPQGTTPTSSPGVISSMTQTKAGGTPTIGNLAGIDPAAISEALSGTFNNFITALQNIQLPKIPEVITMEGRHTVEVIINGAEALKAIDQGIRTMVTDKINEAMKNINNKTEGGFGP